MAYWFLPYPLSEDAFKTAATENLLMFPASGQPDWSKAAGIDQIQAWLKDQPRKMTPEEIAHASAQLWRIGHEIEPEDYVLVPSADGKTVRVAEITGAYRQEGGREERRHGWPARLLDARLPMAFLPKWRTCLENGSIAELEKDEVRKGLQRHIPELREPFQAFFKWISIVILISELVYFWPS